MLRSSSPFLLLAGALWAQAGQQAPYDWLFLNGRVLDGSGNPWYRADVAVRGGRIAAIGDLSESRSRRRVDLDGRVLAPGFIDLHSHAADAMREARGLRSGDPRRRAAPNLVAQGITTVVVNQDGRSAWPIGEQKSQIEELGAGPNVVLLAGHGTIRARVMGNDFRRPASAREVEEMRELMRQAMREGAMGLSAGLEYVPGRWATVEEMVALVSEVAAFRGVYISHQRSEGADPMWYWPSRHEQRPPSLLDAVRETIEIGERANAVVVASHIKAKGSNYWGSAQAAIELIERARERGVEVWADQYPYDTTGSDGNTVLIPAWALRKPDESAGEDGSGPSFADVLRSLLENEEKAAKLRGDIAHEIARRGGAGKIVIFDHPEQALIGKSLAEFARQRGVTPVEAALELQLEGYANRRGGARLRGFSLSEGDIRRYASRPWTATSSDAAIALPEDGPVHARYYGTFPRKIRRYALQQGVLAVEDAIRSSTSLPAAILRLPRRGLLRLGYAADLVVLDLDELKDTATFFKPHQYPEGVDYVLINGVAAVDNGRLTWELPGRVLAR